MFKRISIHGFRGIDGLALEDFRRVNVFVGPNGGGKTSVLEAICVASTPFAPEGLAKVNQWREMPALKSETWHSLLTIFSQMDSHRSISLEIETEEGEATIGITALFGGTTEKSELLEDPTSDLEVSTAGVEERIRGIKSSYKPTGGEEVEGILELLTTGYQQTIERRDKRSRKGPPPKGPGRGSFYIHGRRSTSLGETASVLTALYAARREERFVEALKKVDPRVTRLIPGTQGKRPTVLVDLGYSALVPISVLGDGFCRVSLILTGIVSADPGKLLIVDEIDSGLYHTVMRGLWESILVLSRDYDLQVFCSTHNEEMLHATLDAFSNEPDALRVYRISRNRDGIVSQQMYDYQMLQDAGLVGMDVR